MELIPQGNNRDLNPPKNIVIALNPTELPPKPRLALMELNIWPLRFQLLLSNVKKHGESKFHIYKKISFLKF